MALRRVRGALRRLSDLTFIAQSGPGGRALGLEGIHRRDQLRDLERRFGLDIRTVLYIGANRGQEIDLLCLTFPAATIHCFEPQQECQEDLGAAASKWPGRVHVHPVALTDEVGEATLRRPASHDQASSLLEPGAEMVRQFPHVQEWGEEVVATATLDGWAAEQRLEDDIFVKMDVQGSEPKVIAGGPDVFSRARLVVTELAVIPTYTAAPDMHTMFDRFHSLGFGYAGELEQVRGQDVTVVEFDGAFARSRMSGVS